MGLHFKLSSVGLTGCLMSPSSLTFSTLLCRKIVHSLLSFFHFFVGGWR